MVTNISLMNRYGKNILLHRGKQTTVNLSTSSYLPATKFRVSIDSTVPNENDTSVAKCVPISYGTANNNGANMLTGSDGGSNTTNSTDIYKEGAGEVDATAQNLIATGTGSATKTWTLTDLTASGHAVDITNYFGLWVYVKDASTLAKFSGSGITVRLGSDTANFYYKTFLSSELAIGWNWLTGDTTLVSALSTSGTPTGTIDTFQIIAITNLATDTFASGDLKYDLLRTWTALDIEKLFQTGFPTFDYVNSEATTRCYLTTLEANGFNLSNRSSWNDETVPALESEDLFEADSKSSMDEFGYVIVDRII